MQLPWWCKSSVRIGSRVIQPYRRAPMTPRKVCNKSYHLVSWNLEKSTLHRPETNGRKELCDGLRNSISSGAPQPLRRLAARSEAMACDCYVRHVQHLLADGRTPHEKRCIAPFDGPIWPCGAEILHKPISQKDKKWSSAARQKDVGCHFHDVWPTHKSFFNGRFAYLRYVQVDICGGKCRDGSTKQEGYVVPPLRLR